MAKCRQPQPETDSCKNPAAAASLENPPLPEPQSTVELWICLKWSRVWTPGSTSSFPRSPPGQGMLMVGSSCDIQLCSLRGVWWVLRQGMAGKTRGGGQAPPPPPPATAPGEEDLPLLPGKLTAPSPECALEVHWRLQPLCSAAKLGVFSLEKALGRP